MWLLLELDLSDDDVELQEVAQQCGFDVPLIGVDDVAAPQVVTYREQACLALKLDTALVQADIQQQLWQLKPRLISHPSVSAERVVAVLDTLA